MNDEKMGAGTDQLPPSMRPWVVLLNRVGVPLILLGLVIGIAIGKIDSPLVTMADTQIETKFAITQMTEAVSEHEISQTTILNQLIRVALAGCVNDNLARNDSLAALICTASLGPKSEQDVLINQALTNQQQKTIAATR